jgi:hypothetical protein
MAVSRVKDKKASKGNKNPFEVQISVLFGDPFHGLSRARGPMLGTTDLWFQLSISRF